MAVPRQQGELFAGNSTFQQDLRRELSELLDLLKEDPRADALLHQDTPEH